MAHDRRREIAPYVWVGGLFPIELSGQVFKHGLAGFFGLSERFKGGAADFDGGRALMDRTPRRHEAGASVKAGTAAALITDHERKAVAAPVPDLHVLDGTNDTGELHGHSTPTERHRLVAGCSALPKRVSSTVAWLSPISPLSTREGIPMKENCFIENAVVQFFGP